MPGSSATRCEHLSIKLIAALCAITCLGVQAQVPGPVNAYQNAYSGKASDKVDIVDLTPKFLDFYESAIQSRADPDQRWLLWKQKYDFAAVPPIAAGQKIAREELDAAWSKYPEAIGRIRKGASAITPAPQEQLKQVTSLLGATQPVHIRLIAFVGTFNRNAFATGTKDGISTIAIPIEDSDTNHALDMAHEFTHAVQLQQGNWSGQSVAGQVFTEGLAMHVTEHLLPGSLMNVYTASTPEWLTLCSNKLPDVLRDLKPHLADQGAEAVSNFTYGTGTAGLKREVYCGGWFIVSEMLREGLSYDQLGNLALPEAERRVAITLDRMLAASQPKAQHP